MGESSSPGFFGVVPEVLENLNEQRRSLYRFTHEGVEFPFIDVDVKLKSKDRQIVRSDGPYKLEHFLKNRPSQVRPPESVRAEIQMPSLTGEQTEAVAKQLADLLFNIRETK